MREQDNQRSKFEENQKKLKEAINLAEHYDEHGDPTEKAAGYFDVEEHQVYLVNTKEDKRISTPLRCRLGESSLVIHQPALPLYISPYFVEFGVEGKERVLSLRDGTTYANQTIAAKNRFWWNNRDKGTHIILIQLHRFLEHLVKKPSGHVELDGNLDLWGVRLTSILDRRLRALEQLKSSIQNGGMNNYVFVLASPPQKAIERIRTEFDIEDEPYYDESKANQSYVISEQFSQYYIDLSYQSSIKTSQSVLILKAPEQREGQTDEFLKQLDEVWTHLLADHIRFDHSPMPFLSELAKAQERLFEPKDVQALCGYIRKSSLRQSHNIQTLDLLASFMTTMRDHVAQTQKQRLAKEAGGLRLFNTTNIAESWSKLVGLHTYELNWVGWLRALGSDVKPETMSARYRRDHRLAPPHWLVRQNLLLAGLTQDEASSWIRQWPEMISSRLRYQRVDEALFVRQHHPTRTNTKRIALPLSEVDRRTRLIDWDERVFALTKDLKLLSRLKPKNLKAQRDAYLDAFARGKRHVLAFEYDAPPQSLHALREDLDTLMSDKTIDSLSNGVPFLGNVFRRLRQQKQRFIDMIESVGDGARLFELSCQAHSIDSVVLAPHLSAAKQTLQQPMASEGAAQLDDNMIVQRIAEALRAVGLNVVSADVDAENPSWRVQADDKMVADMSVRSRERLIKVRQGVRLSEQAIERLVAHEVGVHVMRATYALACPLKCLRYGWPGYLRTEEGLAAFNEQVQGVSTLETMRTYAARLVAVDMVCAGHGFDDIFQALLKYHFEPREAFDVALRVKRGCIDPNQPHSGFVKDALYWLGYFDVKQWASTQDSDAVAVQHLLQDGKVALHDRTLSEQLKFWWKHNQVLG